MKTRNYTCGTIAVQHMTRTVRTAGANGRKRRRYLVTIIVRGTGHENYARETFVSGTHVNLPEGTIVQWDY